LGRLYDFEEKVCMRENNFCKSCGWLFFTLAMMLLAGCGQVELLSNLPEKEANEIVSVMQQYKVPIKKVHGVELTWNVVLTDVNSFSRAVEILNSKGFPNVQYNTIGQVFQKSGLVASPLEERARFMYALSETVSETLNKIPGVLTSRVHIVLPENDPYSNADTEASAAIFLTYKAGSNLDESVREIKYLVANSVQGLDYDRVSIALFPVAFEADSPAENVFNSNVSVLGLEMASGSAMKFIVILIAFGCAALASIGLAIFFFLELKKAKKVGGGMSTAVPRPIAKEKPVAVQDAEASINELDETPGETQEEK
jgi:type III secretion protein J